MKIPFFNKKLTGMDKARLIVKAASDTAIVITIVLFAYMNLNPILAFNPIEAVKDTVEILKEIDISELTDPYESPKSIAEAMLHMIMFSAVDIFKKEFTLDSSDNLMNIVLFENGGTVDTFLKVFEAGAAVWILINALGKILQEINTTDHDPTIVTTQNLYKTAIGMFFIINTKAIAEGIAAFGIMISTYAINQAGDTMSSMEAVTLKALCGTDNPSNVVAGAVAMIINLPFVCSFLVRILATTMVYSILFELGIRKMLMPFAVADIAIEGKRCSGTRYLKDYIGIFLKILIMMFIFLMINQIAVVAPSALPGQSAAELMAGNILYLLTVVLMNYIGISMSMQAGSFINDVMR